MIRDMPTRKSPPRNTSMATPVSPRSARTHLQIMRGLPRVLDQLGIDSGPILRTAGLTAQDFEDPERTITFGETDALLGLCVRATRCPHFGLLVGEHINLQSFGIAGRLARHAASVGAALQDLVGYFVLHDSGGTPSIAIHEGTVSVAYGVHTPGIRSSEQVYDLAAVAIHNILRQICGPKWKPDLVLLPRHRTADIQPYREIFGAPVRFDAVQCALLFPASWLEQPISDADPLLHSLLSERAAAELAQASPLLQIEVRRAIRLLLMNGGCSRAAVAARLGMHERTLGRRLQEAGTTFQALLDDARADIAKQLLHDTRTPIARISASMGYQDPTVFTRAFRRWTGKTPREYRAELRNGA